MFDVNSLGGKLIDNQNLKKALENGGSGSSGLNLNVTYRDMSEPNDNKVYIYVDKTAKEIYEAIENGTNVYFLFNSHEAGVLVDGLENMTLIERTIINRAYYGTVVIGAAETTGYSFFEITGNYEAPNILFEADENPYFIYRYQGAD